MKTLFKIFVKINRGKNSANTSDFVNNINSARNFKKFFILNIINKFFTKNKRLEKNQMSNVFKF